MQYLATTKRAIQKPRVRVLNGPLGWHVSLHPRLPFQGEFTIKDKILGKLSELPASQL